MIFALLTLLAALSLAAVAGWFSIIGIMSIYAGAATHALIMGVVLEAGKLVTTSWLYRNWRFSDWRLKTPLIIFTITLMLATSIGVFGFLSKSHLEQGAATVDNGAKIERLDQQIAREKSTISDDEKVIGQLDAAINSYIGKDRTDKSVAVRKSQTPQRNQLRADIESAQKRIDGFSDEKLKLTSEVRKLQLDVGPIRYIAELIYGADNNTDKNIEAAVRMFTLIIVSTLDPLAVILLIAANHTLMRRQNEKEEAINKEKSENTGSTHGEINNIPDAKVVEEVSESIIAPARDIADKTTIEVAIPTDEASSPSAEPEENTIHVPILPEAVGLLDEEESFIVEKVAQEATPDTGIISGDGISPGIPENNEDDRSVIDRYTERQEILPKVEDEIQAAILEIQERTEGGISLPIIRQPSPARVTSKSSPEAISSATEASAMVAGPSPIPEKAKIVAWEDQNPVLREIFGSGPHFVPQKVHEEEKSIPMETSTAPAETSETARDQTGQTQTVEEISQERSGIQTETLGASTSHLSNAEQPKTDKYPKALSWLKEFKRS